MSCDGGLGILKSTFSKWASAENYATRQNREAAHFENVDFLSFACLCTKIKF